MDHRSGMAVLTQQRKRERSARDRGKVCLKPGRNHDQALPWRYK